MTSQILTAADVLAGLALVAGLAWLIVGPHNARGKR